MVAPASDLYPYKKNVRPVPQGKGELMRVPMRLLFTACLALAVASCGAPIASNAFFAPGAFFSPDVAGARGLTFAWNQESDLVIGDPRLQNNPFFEDRIHEAVKWELSLRGMRRVDPHRSLARCTRTIGSGSGSSALITSRWLLATRRLPRSRGPWQ